MCPPGCHHNGFMATPELGHRMYIYYTRGQDDVRKRQFFGVTSHGPKWEIKQQNQGIKNHSILK